MKILVVDDDWMSADIASIYLERQGHECVLAEHGQEALDILHKVDFDVVLTDLNMPVMDGMELTRILRNSPNWVKYAKIRIIMNSTISTDRLQAEAMDTGVDVFIDKACLEQELPGALIF